jgi:hypothetical protein
VGERPPAVKAEQASPFGKFCEALQALQEPIFARPVKPASDVAELALIVLYWTNHTCAEGESQSHFTLARDPNLTEGDCAERPAAFLIQAAARIAMGTTNV